MSERTEDRKNIIVQLLDINGDVKLYEDVKFIKFAGNRPLSRKE